MSYNTSSQPIKFRTKNYVKINDESRGTYNEDNKTKFKDSLLRSILCDYSDANIIVKGTIIVAEATAAAPNNTNQMLIFKNCALFTKCISRINSTQLDNA